MSGKGVVSLFLDLHGKLVTGPHNKMGTSVGMFSKVFALVLSCQIITAAIVNLILNYITLVPFPKLLLHPQVTLILRIVPQATQPQLSGLW
eukprot:1059575-Ditylum_brightwellii.AAC.1